MTSAPSTSPSSADAAGGRTRFGSRRVAVLAALAVLLAAAVVAATSPFWYAPAGPPPAEDLRQSQAESKADPFPLLPISDSPFENTRSGVAYVGSQACVDCHQQEHESFRHTGMGRSMSRVDLSREPPDGQFDHPPSGRRYQVVRRAGWMWHRELLLTGDAEETLVSEFPVKWVTGSGRHSLTYLVETDGFLVESPITWYTSRQAWGMSPGYDRPEHQSFQREVGQGCLVCHAGRSEALGGSLHRMKIVEATIGCERCHGPGALHVKKHSGGGSTAAAGHPVDYSIVNPAHLSRELGEAVCQQCHLRAGATVVSRGRTIDDFRPGLPLTDFRQDYTLEIPDESMTVVGHVDQMHASRCYQASEKFTCVTCHSPHGEPPPAERVAHYRAACVTCHQAESCRVDRQKLTVSIADSDCAACHMPTSPTDIPHLAFTHHRVGIHDGKPAALKPSAAPGLLKPFLDLSRLSEIDRQRSLGLAYIELANHEEIPSRRKHYQKVAHQILTEVHESGLKDGYVDSALASLRFELSAEPLPLALSSLEDERLSGMERCNSLFLAADAFYRRERYEEALATLEALGDLRRHSVQWLLAAQCHQKLGNEAAAVEALLKATQINPRTPAAHRFLANHFRKSGNASRAQWHEKMAGQTR